MLRNLVKKRDAGGANRSGGKLLFWRNLKYFIENVAGFYFMFLAYANGANKLAKLDDAQLVGVFLWDFFGN